MYSSRKYDPHFYGIMKKLQKEETAWESSDGLNKLNAMYFGDYEFYQETGIKNTSQIFRDNYAYFKNAIIDDWLLHRLGNSNHFKVSQDLSFQPTSRSPWFQTIFWVIFLTCIIWTINLFILGEGILSQTFIIPTAIAALLLLLLDRGSFIFNYFVQYLIKRQMALGDQKRQQIRTAQQEKFVQSVRKKYEKTL